MLWRFGGIRIEDDWRSGAQGMRNLTRAAFDSLQ
jgi:Xaa-Pro aminopeptidase